MRGRKMWGASEGKRVSGGVLGVSAFIDDFGA